MNGPRFDQTVRGARFFDQQLPALLDQVPKLLREMARLNANLERIAERTSKDEPR